MTDAQRDIARACMSLQTLPERSFTEAWTVVGRRGGKSQIFALISVYLALFRDWSKYLVPGERGTILVIAADRDQASSVMNYIKAMCQEVPLIAARIERVVPDKIELAKSPLLPTARCVAAH